LPDPRLQARDSLVVVLFDFLADRSELAGIGPRTRRCDVCRYGREALKKRTPVDLHPYSIPAA
jgi:hypothetical protein